MALAIVRHNHPAAELQMVFVDDGRADAAWRWSDCRAQAEAFGGLRTARVSLPGLCRGASHASDLSIVPAPPEPGRVTEVAATFLSPQVLLAGLSFAIDRNAHSLVWPVACDQDTEQVASATQRLNLCELLVQVEPVSADGAAKRLPQITTPLLDWSDRQMIESANQIGAPLSLASSCSHRASGLCMACPACVRRRAAFASAGITDPATTSSRQREVGSPVIQTQGQNVPASSRTALAG